MRKSLLVIVGLLVFVPFFGYAQTDTFCPNGAQLITPTQLTQLQACGATGLTVGMCFDTQTASLLSLSQCAEAKTFLKSLPKETPSQCGTESNASIDGLNPQFSICAANFIKGFTAINGPVRINSAYRTQAQQQCVCNVAAGLCGGMGTLKADGSVEGGSNHLRGVALDITPLNGDFVKLHAFAVANPSFGVHFPLGMGDRQHLEPISMTGPCAAPGQNSLPNVGAGSTGLSGGATQSTGNAGTTITPHPYQNLFTYISYLTPLLTQAFYQDAQSQNTSSNAGTSGTAVTPTFLDIFAQNKATPTIAPTVSSQTSVPDPTALLETFFGEKKGVQTSSGVATNTSATTIQAVLPSVAALLTQVELLPASTPDSAIIEIYMNVIALLQGLLTLLQAR